MSFFEKDDSDDLQTKNIEYLKELTNRLPTMIGMIKDRVGKYITYNIEGGQMQGEYVFKSPEIAVQLLFLKKGTTFGMHSHPVHEWIIIKNGTGINISFGSRISIIKDDFCYFKPNVMHALEATTDMELLAISIPAEEAYPNAI